MLMSSGAAQHPLIGYSGYGSSKIAIEHWVRIVGRDDRLGKPLLYGTTQGFLEQFGVSSLRDLPDPDRLLEGQDDLALETAGKHDLGKDLVAADRGWKRNSVAGPGR